jgi:hypothetical protein
MMLVLNFRLVVILVVSYIIIHTIATESYAVGLSPNKLFIGNDTIYNSDVFLYKDSIVNDAANVKRATYCITLDKMTEEYTADYNCSDKTVHIFKVTIKSSTAKQEEKPLYIYEKVVKGTMDAKLLDAVCKYRR